MKKLMKIGTASMLALATAAGAPAYAQQYRETPQSEAQRQDYEAAQARYRDQAAQYQDRRADYRDARQDYASARAEYQHRLDAWESARAAYDARHGSGAYARYYQRPVWNESQWASADRNGPGRDRPAYESRQDYRQARQEYDRRMADWDQARMRYDRRYGQGAYARRHAPPVWDDARWSNADRYGSNANAVTCNNNTAVGAGVIGAIAGAVLGSNVAARNARTEGAVLGGVVGAAIGAGVGHAHDKYKCDSQGPYFSYDETTPYREGRSRYSSAYDSNYYNRQRCRLAPAPVDTRGDDVRYVRVCPDAQGRYRITG